MTVRAYAFCFMIGLRKWETICFPSEREEVKVSSIKHA